MILILIILVLNIPACFGVGEKKSPIITILVDSSSTHSDLFKSNSEKYSNIDGFIISDHVEFNENPIEKAKDLTDFSELKLFNLFINLFADLFNFRYQFKQLFSSFKKDQKLKERMINNIVKFRKYLKKYAVELDKISTDKRSLRVLRTDKYRFSKLETSENPGVQTKIEEIDRQILENIKNQRE